MKKLVIFASLVICFSGCCKASSSNSSDIIILEETLRTLTGEVDVLKHDLSNLRNEVTKLKEEIAQNAIKEQNNKFLNIVMTKQPEELVRIADDMIEENRCDEARKLLQTFIDNNQKHIYVGKMKFYIGKSYFREKNYKSAAKEFLDSYTVNSKGAKSAEALYMLALSFAELSKKVQMKEALKKVISDYPSSEFAEKSRNKLKKLK